MAVPLPFTVLLSVTAAAARGNTEKAGLTVLGCAAVVRWGPARSPERRPPSSLRFWNAAAPPAPATLLLKGTSTGAQPAPAAARTSRGCLTTSARVTALRGWRHVWSGTVEHVTDPSAQAAAGLTRPGGPACLSWDLRRFSSVESGRDTVGHPSGALSPLLDGQDLKSRRNDTGQQRPASGATCAVKSRRHCVGGWHARPRSQERGARASCGQAVPGVSRALGPRMPPGAPLCGGRNTGQPSCGPGPPCPRAQAPPRPAQSARVREGREAADVPRALLMGTARSGLGTLSLPMVVPRVPVGSV